MLGRKLGSITDLTIYESFIRLCCCFSPILFTISTAADPALWLWLPGRIKDTLIQILQYEEDNIPPPLLPSSGFKDGICCMCQDSIHLTTG